MNDNYFDSKETMFRIFAALSLALGTLNLGRQANTPGRIHPTDGRSLFMNLQENLLCFAHVSRIAFLLVEKLLNLTATLGIPDWLIDSFPFPLSQTADIQYIQRMQKKRSATAKKTAKGEKRNAQDRNCSGYSKFTLRNEDPNSKWSTEFTSFCLERSGRKNVLYWWCANQTNDFA